MMTRRGFLGLGAAGSLAGLAGCKGDCLSILGYQIGNDALYDKNIKTVFVRTFYNRTIQVSPYRMMEVYLTNEVVHQIQQKTPFRIADKSTADTELIAKIFAINKNIMNVTQQNQVREGELVITVDVVWRDLRDGRILSAPRRTRNPNAAPVPAPRRPNEPPPEPFDPDVVPPPDAYSTPEPQPYRIIGRGRYIPEFGESDVSAENAAIISVATQIVSMMEKPW